MRRYLERAESKKNCQPTIQPNENILQKWMRNKNVKDQTEVMKLTCNRLRLQELWKDVLQVDRKWTHMEAQNCKKEQRAWKSQYVGKSKKYLLLNNRNKMFKDYNICRRRIYDTSSTKGRTNEIKLS